MPRNPLRVALVLVLVLFTAWVTGGPPGALAGPGAAGTVPLRVMNINIFYGGDELNLDSMNWCIRPDGCPETLARVVEAIRAAAPDVVGLEEAEHNTRPIAEALGWHYSERMQIVSRYPLIDPPGGDAVYIFVRLAPGRVAALMNVHLPSDPYGPYLVRDGATLQEVLDLENALRLPAVRDQLRALPGLLAAGIPVFLTGDFNSPSHLDWTPEVDAVREVVRYPVDWPVSRALADAGFHDSYRAAHPDPVAVPGFTWTPGGPESVSDEVHDRIDWVLAAGSAFARDSTVVGEAGFVDAGVVVTPYPTDHRGVVSTFDVAPGTMPILVAVGSRRVTAGDDVSVAFHAPGRSGEQVAIVPAGGAAGDAVALQPTGSGAPTDGTVVFPTAGLAPRAYEAVLLDPKNSILSRSPFWLYAPGTGAQVFTSKEVYVAGEPIEVRWTGAPGMRWDWLGIYAPGDSEDTAIDSTRTSGYGGNYRYLLYEYTHTAIEGTASFTANSFPGWISWPLGPGTYEIRLLLDDGYRSLAGSAPFKVVNP